MKYLILIFLRTNNCLIRAFGRLVRNVLASRQQSAQLS
jgi:hypothetical protein